MRVTIASRRSDLARIQAYQVGKVLSAVHPQIAISYSFHESLGDKNLNDPLWQMPQKGVFTQDFREGLLRGDFDLVVHSWKDLAIEADAETEIAATLPRADARDLLLVRESHWPAVERSGTLSILTSSPRRAYNLGAFLPDALPTRIQLVNFVNVRGNVPTRVRKLFESDVDGLLVAKAAIDRLLEASQAEFAATQEELRKALSECRWMVLPLSASPSAPAQGALAVEISCDRHDMRELLAPVNCAATYEAVTRERGILASYGGGCHQKIGVSVLRRDFGDVTFLRGVTDEGIVLDSQSLPNVEAELPSIRKEEAWPRDATEARLFRSERLMAAKPPIEVALFIAKTDALPADWTIDARQIVWTSGLKTWKRLAQRGVWVNGSTEGLGEAEPARIETIVGSEVKWVKLTHDRGYKGMIPVLPTYKLAVADGGPNLTGRKHFFWKSGSAFEYALFRNPWLQEMTHYCGPGNTQQILGRHGIEPIVLLNYEAWLKEISE